jgi:hypothetical protein
MLTVARLALGFATFVFAQRLGWFLDDGRSAGVTLGALFVAGLITSERQSPLSSGLGVAVGACAAMAVVLFRRGPGTIFPLVLAVGGTLVIAFSVAGAFARTFGRKQ